MKHLAVLTVLFALSAGQVLQAPSSFKDGVKWEFGTDVSHDDVSGRSNVNANTFNQAPVAPTVYKKELVTLEARRAPVDAVYNKPSADVYKKFVVPTVYRQEPLVPSVQQQQLRIPTIFKEQPIASNIYKSQPVVHNVVYKQQAAVPIVHKPYPAVSNVYQFKSQPVQPVVQYYEPAPLQDYVPKAIVPVNSQKKVASHTWSYPHHALVGDVRIVPHN
ncbi:hypothetical protein ALC60_08343 [Trachymyrmex zeteki]|uniref:Uncharacterized protein n=1 Tax=Mycetomoellerius zeteki TaxID=64791 RepID=A0A151WX65_9HYME|nr:hypothetical protein ALC60_08343 [Trachymyrmex zeteki]